MSFWQDYKWVILFYSTIVLLLYIFRSKFEMHSKIMAMYKTKIGLKLMDRLGKKHSEFFKWIGYIGIGVGFIGTFVIVFFLLKNMWTMFFVKGAQSSVSLVIPGVKVPGSPIMIPLVTGWIALFVVVLVHEFSHGVIARAHGLKVKSSGVFFLGPLMGAFVEPEEKELVKAKDTVQYSVYAAGPWSNVLLALLVLFLLTFCLAPLGALMTNDVGVQIVGITPGYPAEEAGLPANSIITDINGVPILSYEDLSKELSYVRPGEELKITADDKVYDITAAENPGDTRKGYLGVMSSNKPVVELKSEAWYYNVTYAVLKWITELFAIIGILSMGIGLANLLPLGPVDGGRMQKVLLEKTLGAKKGNYVWLKISIITLAILAINLLWPILKGIVAYVV